MHGDAAYAGQGVWAETLNLSYLRGYTVGGTVNVIVNNLLGFTTNPAECLLHALCLRHVEAAADSHFPRQREDPDAVVRVARWAVEYRYRFASDVVIDLIGYRRHGHSEVDDPTITQPIVYRKIKEHPPLYQIYASRIGADAAPQVERMRARMQEAKKQAQQMKKKPLLYTLPSYWDAYMGGPTRRASKSRPRSTPGKSPARAVADALSAGLQHPSQGQEAARSAAGMARASSPSTTAWPRRWPSARWRWKARRSGSAARTAGAAPLIIGTRP